MSRNVQVPNVARLMLALGLFVLVDQRTVAAQSNPLKKHGRPTRVAAIRFAQWGGLGDGYSTELQVNDGQAILTETSSSETQRRYPNLRVRADLSAKHWQELQALVERDVMLSLPDRTSCGTCVDDLDELIEVKFRDHSKKSVTYAEGSTPEQLRDLVVKLKALEERLQNELPPKWRNPH